MCFSLLLFGVFENIFIYSLTTSYMYTMCLDCIHPQFILPTSPISLTCPPPSPLFKNNLLSPINAAHMHMAVEPSTGTQQSTCSHAHQNDSSSSRSCLLPVTTHKSHWHCCPLHKHLLWPRLKAALVYGYKCKSTEPSSRRVQVPKRRCEVSEGREETDYLRVNRNGCHFGGGATPFILYKCTIFWLQAR